MKQSYMNLLQCRCSGNDFNQFTGDHGLSGTVEGQTELVNHLASVLAGVLHGRHPGRLFAAGTLFESVVDQSRQGELDVALQYFVIQ